MAGIRKQFSAEFKAKVALEALKDQKTLAELASEYGAHPTQISAWRNQLKDQMATVFGRTESKSLQEKDELIEQLYKNIGKLQVESDWLKKKLHI
jgi:transposase-like protein